MSFFFDGENLEDLKKSLHTRVVFQTGADDAVLQEALKHVLPHVKEFKLEVHNMSTIENLVKIIPQLDELEIINMNAFKEDAALNLLYVIQDNHHLKLLDIITDNQQVAGACGAIVLTHPSLTSFSLDGTNVLRPFCIGCASANGTNEVLEYLMFDKAALEDFMIGTFERFTNVHTLEINADVKLPAVDGAFQVYSNLPAVFRAFPRLHTFQFYSDFPIDVLGALPVTVKRVVFNDIVDMAELLPYIPVQVRSIGLRFVYDEDIDTLKQNIDRFDEVTGFDEKLVALSEMKRLGRERAARLSVFAQIVRSQSARATELEVKIFGYTRESETKKYLAGAPAHYNYVSNMTLYLGRDEHNYERPSNSQKMQDDYTNVLLSLLQYTRLESLDLTIHFSEMTVDALRHVLEQRGFRLKLRCSGLKPCSNKAGLIEVLRARPFFLDAFPEAEILCDMFSDHNIVGLNVPDQDHLLQMRGAKKTITHIYTMVQRYKGPVFGGYTSLTHLELGNGGVYDVAELMAEVANANIVRDLTVGTFISQDSIQKLAGNTSIRAFTFSAQHRVYVREIIRFIALNTRITHVTINIGIMSWYPEMIQEYEFLGEDRNKYLIEVIQIGGTVDATNAVFADLLRAKKVQAKLFNLQLAALPRAHGRVPAMVSRVFGQPGLGRYAAGFF